MKTSYHNKSGHHRTSSHTTRFDADRDRLDVRRKGGFQKLMRFGTRNPEMPKMRVNSCAVRQIIWRANIQGPWRHPNYVLQYDLDCVYMRNNNHASSTVYDNIIRLLTNRGFEWHQYSCWRVDNKTAFGANYDANFVATQMELRFGVGIIPRLHYERRTNFFVVR